MFQRYATAVVVIALVLSLVGTAYGQGKVELAGKDTSGVKMTVSGAADMDYVYRDGVMQELRAGAAGWTLRGAAGTDSTNFWNGKFTVRMDIDLAEKVFAVIEMENERYAGGAADVLGDDNTDVLFEQANVRFADLFYEGLTATLGVQDVRQDVRGKGHPFFLDVSEADSTWTDAGSVVPRKAFGYSEATGLNLSYKEKTAPWTLSFGAYTIWEGGATSDDEDVYLLNLAYNLPESAGKNSLLNLLASSFNGMGSDRQVYTLGAELALNDIGSAGTELFGGMFFQFGDAGQDATGDAIDAKGNAFYVGGRYTFASTGKPWLEIAYWSISGDNDAADGDEDRFLSYENVDQFMILESDTFGLDVDSNYTAFKFSGGTYFSVAGKPDNLNLTANLGFFSLDEKIPAVGGTEDDLGTEFDLSLVYAFSKNVSLDLNAGFLFGSDSIEDYNVDEENDARMFTLGTNVTF